MSAAVKLVVQVVLSLGLVVAGVYIIVKNYDADTKKLASGWVGIVIGYWLR